MAKKITALMNAPQSNTWPLIVNVPPACLPPPTTFTSGSMNDLPNWATTAVNAVPIATATARSTTLPRKRKSLRPLSMFRVPSSQAAPSDRALRRSKGNRQPGTEGGGDQAWREVAGHGQHDQRALRKAPVRCLRDGQNSYPCHHHRGGPVLGHRDDVHPVAGPHQGCHTGVGQSDRHRHRPGPSG